MDAKRRRLLSESPACSRESSAGRSLSVARDAEPPPPLDPATLPPIDLFKTDDLPAIEEAVNQLRKTMITREAIAGYIALPDRLHSLVRLLHRASNSVASPDSGWSSILRSLVSLLGNMCNFSMRVCFELAQPRLRFATMATHLLESGARTCINTKASVLRLTGNLCQKKESARSIASCGALIDKVSSMLEDDNESVRTHSFRVIRMLIERNFHRAVLLSNGGFYLGKLLLAVHADEKRASPVISTLTRLTRYSAKDTGRQLSTSECTPLLLRLFLSPASPQPQKDLLLLLAAGSTDIRDRLGETDVIADLTQGERGGGDGDEAEDVEHVGGQKSEVQRASEKERCALLATFTQDAWGRAALRESGALDVLCARLAEATESTAEKATILVSFRHLVHDTTSMAYLCRSRVFIDCVIKDVGEYVDCYGDECEPISLRDRDTSHRPWSPILVEPEQRQERRTRNEKRPLEGQALILSYAASPVVFSPPHAFSTSPSPSLSPPLYGAVSPLMSSPDSRLSLSPPSSSRQSPEWGSGTASPGESLASSYRDRAGSSIAGGVEEREEENETEKERKLMKQVVDNELWLVGWQANEDANLPYLMREDLVKCLLSLLRMVSPHSTRLGRPLKRMADSRHSIEGLLSMHFHSRIFHALCTPPCRMTRFARRCKRCEQDAEFGSEILRSFSTSVDSDFGHGLLMQKLTSEERETRVAAAVAKISLIRNRCRLSRRPSGEHSSSLQVLLGELRRILMERDYDTESRCSLYEGGPPTLVLIIGALSTLLDSSKIKDAFEIDATWKPPTIVECKVVTRRREDEGGDLAGPSTCKASEDKKEGEEEKDEEEDMVSFEDSRGNVFGEIAMVNLRKGSEYFNGMFSSDMVESRERRRKFVIDEIEEGCTSEEFRVFLHCLADCSPAICLCQKVQRVETCMALIRLADKYLCSSLSTWILGPHGPARRLLDGASLHLFLPLALHLYTHHKVMDACLVTLLRFSSDSNICQSMEAIAGETAIVEEFVQKMANFIHNNSIIAV